MSACPAASPCGDSAPRRAQPREKALIYNISRLSPFSRASPAIRRFSRTPGVPRGVLSLSNHKNNRKKAGNCLIFVSQRCTLLFGIGRPSIGCHTELLTLVFQQKYEKTRQVCKCSFVPESKYASKDHCVFVSCWAFLCRFRNRFLAEPTFSRMGRRPAFFMSGSGLVRYEK